MNIDDLIRDNIKNLAPYSTARDEYQGGIGTYLDANENPYDSGYNRYPDPYQKALKHRISQIKGIPASRIFIGNGSDEPIDLVYRIFCDPGVHNAVSIAPTYGMYKVAAAVNNVEFREVMLDDGYKLNGGKILAATDENTRLVFLCSPNNPSGNLLDGGEIVKIIENFKGIVVLDEAYSDFADTDGFLHSLDKYPNLVIFQTLSKAWGMAGLRLGLAFAGEEIIKVLTRVKYPYNINVVTQKLVLDLLSDISGKEREVAELKRERERTVAGLADIETVREVFPTDSNFVLVKVDDPRGMYNKLIDEGVIVRDRSRIRGCEGCLRITIGTPEENSKLLRILKNASR